MKAAAKTSAPRVAKATAAASQAVVRRQPTHAEIAVRAYEIYLSRSAAGSGDAALDAATDWLQAERELT